MLIKKGAHMNELSGIFDSSLVAASSAGHLGVVELLVEKGADMNAREGHCSALVVASGDISKLRRC